MQDDTPFPIASLGDDVCMVAASGELDGSTAWRLEDALGSAHASGARRLIADFAAVTYFDADALTVTVQGTHLEVTYTGTIESKDSLKGTVNLGGLGDGTFTAKRQ